MEINSVNTLLQINFGILTLEEKVKIKEKGRLTPKLIISQKAVSKGKSYFRHFNDEMYNRFKWMCGCSEKNKFFCFPCLLFGGDAAWTKEGTNNLKRLNEKCTKHASSLRHLNNAMSLALLGTINIANELNSAYHKAISDFNLKVDKNREVLSKIIDCIKFCSSFDLPLRGHNEKEDSNNPGVFLGLINFAKELDSELKKHLENCTVFKGTSKTIQNELLQCMLDVCRSEILREIAEVDYLALLGDEATDVSNCVQFVMVLRYVLKCGSAAERFWGFFNPTGQAAIPIADCIKPELKKILPNNPEKLIAQGYDAAPVMSGHKTGVNMQIKEEYKNANYIHCEAHQLNLVMERATTKNIKNPAVRKFLASLDTVPKFFSHSPHRLEVLDKCVAQRVPSVIKTRWNYNSRTVNMVFEHKEALLECFQTLSERPGETNSTIVDATNLVRTMEDPDFNYWLNFFHEVMPHVDTLYQQLQGRQIDATKVKRWTQNFIDGITNIRTKRAAENESDSDDDEPPQKRRRVLRNKTESRRNLAVQACDVIIKEAKERFEFTAHLDASSLFIAENFKDFDKTFPHEKFETTIDVFPDLDSARLKTELMLLYSREEIRCATGAIPLLKFIIQNNLQNTFTEIVKLLNIIITMPMSTAEAERCFSTLKRIKDFLRNTMDQERLNALAMLSIEKDFIRHIPDFNKKVIERFASDKNRRMDFVYKHQ